MTRKMANGLPPLSVSFSPYPDLLVIYLLTVIYVTANPKCESGNCGEWKRPMKSNPAYKGKWRAPMIDNPAYKGVWAPRKIENPAYFEDKTPSNFEPIGAVGIEIWTMQKDSGYFWEMST